MKTCLIVGLGMGSNYKSWFLELGFEVVTVDADSNKNPDFNSIQDAIIQHKNFDISYIGTPNWLHEIHTREVAEVSKIVLIEKPGVLNSSRWIQLINDYPNTRIMMIKNNQYRAEVKHYQQLADQSKTVYIRWNNKNRIPNPGSWFTDKEYAFGGVSRDLLPHMLSYFTEFTDYASSKLQTEIVLQNHTLSSITSTDYGTVNPNGIYNVDDSAFLEYYHKGTRWLLIANWKDNTKDDSSISFDMASSAIRHELGLCPKEAYQKMITTALLNLNNNDFWKTQLDQDVWIHQQIENL